MCLGGGGDCGAFRHLEPEIDVAAQSMLDAKAEPGSLRRVGKVVERRR